MCVCVLCRQTGCCEVVTEEASAALRKANKWAQSGLIVSVGPPVEALVQETSGATTTGDKKKSAQTAVCRDRNADLARCVYGCVVNAVDVDMELGFRMK